MFHIKASIPLRGTFGQMSMVDQLQTGSVQIRLFGVHFYSK